MSDFIDKIDFIDVGKNSISQIEGIILLREGR